MKRTTVLPWTIWALALAFAVFVPMRCSQGQERSPDTFTATGADGSYVRIKDEPCHNAPDWLDLRLAEMRYQGKEFKACWFRLGNFIVVLDESKDKSPIPIGAFKKDTRT